MLCVCVCVCVSFVVLTSETFLVPCWVSISMRYCVNDDTKIPHVALNEQSIEQIERIITFAIC